ncbi:putative secreted RxLR effector protein [Phytophthora cinnamomi]|uniref:putative secreted RxLR effector protein n=1 Tax=Phytophthora cinnamomi TaxID=4785 RepID=UPI002A330890|nr:putative secreted RxLR effector protein [Phytophthora cinnamomi]KAJ8516211.1 hypothetical protein ON010_g18471 [Phytophthora cinnamomi]
MRLHYTLLVVVATLVAASSAISADGVADDVKILAAASVNQAYSSGTIQADSANKRFLRTSDTTVTEDTKPVAPNRKFIEHKLQKALSNPKKTQRLYKTWYKKGYTAKQVASELDQDESRELENTYKVLYSGYAAYVKEQKSQ